MSSIGPPCTVEPLHRVLLAVAGDSQFAQSVSSMESKPSGVQEKCLLFAGRDFSGDTSLRVLLGVGGAVTGDDASKRLAILWPVWPFLDRA